MRTSSPILNKNGYFKFSSIDGEKFKSSSIEDEDFRPSYIKDKDFQSPSIEDNVDLFVRTIFELNSSKEI